MKKMKIGVVGCGNISSAYFSMGKHMAGIEVACCADLDLAKAKAQAEKFGVPKVCTVEEMLRDPEVELVLNLTIPAAHTEVALKAIAAGKHTYSEKPLALNRQDGRKILDAAKAKGVRVGCAPDTFLGSGIQTARQVLDDGKIGRPVAGTAFMMCRGHETWHPAPEFYYKPGGGPMLDMGPYYLTALINLLGPIKRVCGFAAITMPERTITSQPKNGQKIVVETPDHVAGTLEFENGAIISIIMSFAITRNIHDGRLPITIWGTEGALGVPDPNGFDGEVKLATGTPYSGDWQAVPSTHPLGLGRMVGVADMAQAIRSGRPHRASGELALAVLDAMQAFLECGTDGKIYQTIYRAPRPAPMPQGKLLRVLLDD